MKTSSRTSRMLLSLVACLGSSALFSGCQSTIGGQTLPSPDYLTDDVQYYPAGPENKLANQIEASKKQAAEKQKLEQAF